MNEMQQDEISDKSFAKISVFVLNCLISLIIHILVGIIIHCDQI